MKVNKQEPIEFVNECGCLIDLDTLERAIIWYQGKPTARLKKIYMHGNYPAVSIHREKIHVHRLIYSYSVKRKLKSSEHVHHKNHNKLDARASNLELEQASDHLSKHNKGRKFSQSHKDKIATANKNRRGVKIKRRIDIPLHELKGMLDDGMSISAIARHFKCGWDTVKARINENPELIK